MRENAWFTPWALLERLRALALRLDGVANGAAGIGEAVGLAQDGKAFRLARRLRIAGGQQHRDMRIVGPDAAGEGEPVHLARHHDIAEDEIDTLALRQQIEGGGGVIHSVHTVAELL